MKLLYLNLNRRKRRQTQRSRRAAVGLNEREILKTNRTPITSLFKVNLPVIPRQHTSGVGRPRKQKEGANQILLPAKPCESPLKNWVCQNCYKSAMETMLIRDGPKGAKVNL